jgi:formate dehydrogenase major subunit
MEKVNITINGRKISAPAGSTVLRAAQEAGIDIPTLCNHPALAPIGVCRICLVEVKGMPAFQPACTSLVAEGMEVQTETPPLVEARKFVLDMLFSERNHFCMYCEMSGNCELQNLGYRYRLDHWVYPTYTKPFPIDATHQQLLLEHNRCVLCRRCVRSCSDLTANHTLDLRERGIESMVQADTHVPFGDSSCISCGGCAQVCPTGAIFDKRSAYMGPDKKMAHVQSTCSQCSLGCGMKVFTRGDIVVRVEGDWDAAMNGGRLCKKGRFDPLNEERQRVTRPLLRRRGGLEPASWEEALQAVAERMGAARAQDIGVLTSSRLTNEALYQLGKLFRQEMKVTNVGLLNGVAPKTSGKTQGSLADIQKSDLILVVGVDPVKDQPVASFLVKGSVDRGARLIVVDGKENGLAPFAHQRLEMTDIDKALDIAQRATNPVVLYGAGIPEKAANALKKLSSKAAFVALEPGVNTRAAAAFGFHNGFKPPAAKVLYLLLGEQRGDGEDLFKEAGKDAFLVVQASYESPLTLRADVVLPAAIWSEQAGSLTSTEGRLLKINRVLEPRGEAKPDLEIISLLGKKLGKKLATSLDEVSARAAQELK